MPFWWPQTKAGPAPVELRCLWGRAIGTPRVTHRPMLQRQGTPSAACPVLGSCAWPTPGARCPAYTRLPTRHPCTGPWPLERQTLAPGVGAEHLAEEHLLRTQNGAV